MKKIGFFFSSLLFNFLALQMHSLSELKSTNIQIKSKILIIFLGYENIIIQANVCSIPGTRSP